MKKYVLLTLILCCSSCWGYAVETYIFATRDTCKLKMDVYRPAHNKHTGTCVIFAFGGGFRSGSRNSRQNAAFMDSLSKHGLTAIAIDYRLGLKGHTEDFKSISHTVHRYITANHIAVEDMYAATLYAYQHAEELGIDRSKILLCGSSAGAMTALQCDFELQQGSERSKVLPQGFRYAGIIALAGAVSRLGTPFRYNSPPAPTLLFHGTEDELVFYNKFVIVNKGLYGSNAIAKRFKKEHYPFCIYRFEHYGHEISTLPMRERIPEIMRFIQLYVWQGATITEDITITDPSVTEPLLQIHLLDFAGGKEGKCYVNPAYKQRMGIQ